MYMIGEPVKLAEIVKTPQDIEEIQADEGGYIGEGGLLHCGKCKGKKQTRLPASDFTNGREMVVRCLCK